MKFIGYIFLLFAAFSIFSFQSHKKDKHPEEWKKYSCSIAGFYQGGLKNDELASIAKIGKIDPPKSVNGCNIKIKSFIYLHVNLKSLPVYRELVNGDKLTGTIKGKLTNSKPGDYIIFESIIGECSETKKQITLPSMVFFYNDILPLKSE